MTTVTAPFGTEPNTILEEARAMAMGLATEQAYGPADVLAAIMGSRQLPGGDAQQAQMSIVSQILAAETLTDAIAGTSAEGAETILDRDIDVLAVRWFPSSFDQNATCFALISCADCEDGLMHSVSTGSVQVMTIIWRAWVEDSLPLRCRITRSKRATANGYFPFNLIPATYQQ